MTLQKQNSGATPVQAGLNHIADILGNTSYPSANKPYTAEISRKNPAAILFLLDQSGSMGNSTRFENMTMRYSEALARIINQFLEELINKCTREDGVRPYFDLSIWGYDDSIRNLFYNAQGADWISTSDLDATASNVEISVTRLVRGNEVVKQVTKKEWIKPYEGGRTSMGLMFDKAKELLETWIADHSDSYPPIVINISDGGATDVTDHVLQEKSHAIRSLATSNGQVLLINVHLSSSGDPVTFPHNRDELTGNSYQHLLYDLSSVLPESFYAEIARFKEEDIYNQYVGMASNVPVDQLVKVLNIGTQVTNNTK
ncbi:MAG: vWA domain-containing protein [Bacteroidales bacterium]